MFIEHQQSECSFIFSQDGMTCRLDYEWKDPLTISLTHTYVVPELRGQGIAEALVKEAVQFAEKKGLKLLPVCSYVAKLFCRHPEWVELLAPGADLYMNYPSCHIPINHKE